MRNSLVFRDFNTNPFYLFNDIERDMRDLFDLTPKSRYRMMNTGSRNAPLCDVRDSDSHYFYSFDLPGVKKEDLKVELQNGSLHVSGERKAELKDGDYTEKSYGKFERVIALPEGIKDDHIEANYENGVLTLAVPKIEKVKPKSITINEGKKDGIWNRLISGKGKEETKSTKAVEDTSSTAA